MNFSMTRVDKFFINYQ